MSVDLEEGTPEIPTVHVDLDADHVDISLNDTISEYNNEEELEDEEQEEEEEENDNNDEDENEALKMSGLERIIAKKQREIRFNDKIAIRKRRFNVMNEKDDDKSNFSLSSIIDFNDDSELQSMNEKLKKRKEKFGTNVSKPPPNKKQKLDDTNKIANRKKRFEINPLDITLDEMRIMNNNNNNKRNKRRNNNNNNNFYTKGRGGGRQRRYNNNNNNRGGRGRGNNKWRGGRGRGRRNNNRGRGRNFNNQNNNNNNYY